MGIETAGKRIRKGHAGAEAFDKFYDREYGAVVGLAYVLSGRHHAAEDLAQDAFIAAHRRWDEIAAYDDPAAWVRKVVANMAVSSVRRRVSEARALFRLRSNQRPAVTFIAAEHVEVWATVRTLPRNQAIAIALHYLEDWPLAKIADALDCAEGTVKSHLHRGRLALADRLGVADEEEPDDR